MVGSFYENELFADDVLKYADLRRQAVPAGTISAATGGDVMASRRLRTTLAPHGFGDELRVMFAADGAFWGEACFLRADPFSAAETAFVASLGRHLAHGLATGRPPAAPAAVAPVSGGPGVLHVDDACAALGMTSEAGGWLTELGWTGDPERLPYVVQGVVGRARACALGGGADGPPRARLRAASGRWLAVHASAWPAGGWSVVLEPARPSEVLPLVSQAHGLTAREQEVLGLMLQGAPDKEIARRLVLSDHTAREHTRAVLRKMGGGTRAELQARVHADCYTPWTAAA